MLRRATNITASGYMKRIFFLDSLLRYSEVSSYLILIVQTEGGVKVEQRLKQALIVVLRSCRLISSRVY